MNLFTTPTLITCDVKIVIISGILGPRTEKTLPLRKMKGTQNTVNREEERKRYYFVQ